MIRLNKKQTAVEWLLNHLEVYYNIRERFLADHWGKLKEQAKEMEKEQIIDAHLFGLLRPLEMEATKQAEQYYNETYGNK